MLKGKIGDTTYYVAESRQLARQALNNSNYGATASRTDVQQTRRVRWANLVNFYSGNKAWMKKAYENLKPGVSIFNRFMQLNLPKADIALTKSQAQAKLWVVTPLQISQGSLPSISPAAYAEGNASKVNVDISVNAETTVAQLSQDIVDNNAEFINGDAIVCVIFSGTTTAPNVASAYKPASYLYHEFVVNVADTRLVSEVYPELEVINGALANYNAQAASAFVYIHTRKSAGKLYVSTETMVTKPDSDTSVPEWRAQAQITSAIATYGEATSVPLAPGGNVSSGSGNDSSSGGGIEDEPGGEGSLE